MLVSPAGLFPDWSPDGSLLAYSTWQEGGRIEVSNLLGEVIILATAPFSSHPRFSPDGTRIAFTAGGVGRGSLVVLTVASGRAEVLADDATGFIEWSPDGGCLASTAGTLDDVDLYVIDATSPSASTRDAQRITRSGSVSHPSWSPSGDRIVFLSREHGNDDLYLIDTRCGVPTDDVQPVIRQLTDTIEDELSPVWFPDGRHVAYATGSESSWRIVLLDVGSLSMQQIVGGLASPDSLDAYVP